MTNSETKPTFVINSVIQTNKAKRQRGKTYRFGDTSCFELIYKLDGESRVHFAGKTFIEKAGTVRFLPKMKNPDYYVDIIEPGECIDIFFDADFPIFPSVVSVDCSDKTSLRSDFERIIRMWLKNTETSYLECMSLFYRILAALKAESYLPTDRLSKIEAGITYLNEHCFDAEIDYYEPSALSGISYTYFKQLFIKKFGVTPVRYVTVLKLKRAAEMLKTGLFGVSETAEAVGINDVYYFSKKFKAEYGVSPKTYAIGITTE